MTPSLNSIVSRLHLKQLRLLIALGDHGSLLSAAKQVSLTQPGASKALQEIETTFGTPLFNRTNRGLEPNEVGHCVIRYARLIHTDLAHLREEIVGIMRGHGGRVSVGVIMGAVPQLTDAVSALIAQHPEMSVEIVEDTSATLLSLIDAGRLDLAVCRTTISQTPQLYESIKVQDETLAVIANIHHPLCNATQLTLKDLADFRWVVYRANMPMRMLLEREFLEAGIRFPLHLLETTSAFATLTLLQNNPSFVALVSIDVAEFFSCHGITRILPVPLASRSEPYELVTRKGAPISPGAKLLIERLLATSAGDNGDSGKPAGDDAQSH
ncbi:TPA: LysR family transcriptional regulator [Burkholderia contaminans]|uniref:LysR family transcriptional regulator n=1 Tax=Burkholderia TaxID=32008 RepID=UPI000759DFCF|nr:MULTISPECIES: LysR family transcriptional regulator [Burkholderia]KVS21950.1 LysR family transcriptional regulator [Burkholderia vietnamiensis]MBM6431226.1 LysR family transcriptional regulator [Burkholderia contaminans]MBR7913849.1 LysR family transcriptional regulator [Burkholderia vietnamiensis]MBR8003693.1 LysR family transcriptional regulator [Burkholderia vietnamiensis]MBR8015794.1 LysR family transcriptional regulator [Burkholderia vietnamiensis]